MKIRYILLIALAFSITCGCAGTTSIASLALPPVSIIEGTVTQIDEGGFTLTDDSGSIPVMSALSGNKKLNISVNERVKVYGNLRGGRDRIFDGYVIKKSTGEQIIVTNPTPHFGFIIQSSFK